MEYSYIGEQLLPGQLGQLFINSAFAAAFFGMIAYAFAVNQQDSAKQQGYKNAGRFLFLLHGLAVLGIVATLFYIIFYHRYEYYYAWQHSSRALPLRYIFSCFWEGQEGSFLLWTFWHVILGWFLIWRGREWEAPVMAVFSFAQLFLMSMLLGIYIFDYKLGSNPFTLLRDAMAGAPILQRADYLKFVTDGTGLNPLLQNYWMTIHPPTLFLGFASTLIPFAFAVSGFWKKDYTGWIAPALPYTLFSSAVLGLGILMGGAWAYESLTFGGFWAWDPVENASLVPWITLIAGLHTMLAFKHSGHGLRATYFFFIITFILILYSTFLTRSGVLGESSVHSFTDLGMSGQLIVFMLAFILPAFFLLAWNWKKLPSPQKEESAYSREFWLFIGSLIFLVSAFQITFTTSIPVYNKIFGTSIAPPTDPIKHYNEIQVWFALIIGFGAAAIQYFRYKNTDLKKFLKAISVSFGISIIVGLLFCFLLNIYAFPYVLLMISGVFAVVANLNYIITVLSGKIKVAGGSVAHIGFGLMLLGILISNEKQEVISINHQGIDFGEEFDKKNKRENILLQKGIGVSMGDYIVTYKGDSVAEPNHYYKVFYEKVHPKTGKITETFTLYPNAQINPQMGIIANPDTRHYLTKDIYTHVTSVPDKSDRPEESEWDEITVGRGDTFFTSKHFVVFNGFDTRPNRDGLDLKEEDLAVAAVLEVIDLEGEMEVSKPVYYIKGNLANSTESTASRAGIQFKVLRILPETQKVIIGYKEDNVIRDFIIMKAIVFPFINVLWLGCIVMMIGFSISIVHRRSQNRRLRHAAA